jgi:GTPase
MFLDQVSIVVQAGDGGDGSIHFRREKYVPRGGPDGGDGGRGGDVILTADPTCHALSDFSQRRSFQAESGGPGQRRNMRGKSAPALNVRVPPGTVIHDEDSGQVLGDLLEAGQSLTVAHGGRGGRGNARFASASNQAPRVAEHGAPGESHRLRLELKLIPDIGIVGVPNAGKSTLLASLTMARPKIAAYPFTTLQPNLGVAELSRERTAVLADIPGLTEGAHLGAGLGYDFLRHIQRTRVLIHLLDGAGVDPLADFSQINSELSLFDEELSRKPQVVAFNKMDLPEAQQRWPAVKAELEKRGHTTLAVSALARTGVRDLLTLAVRLLDQMPAREAVSEMPVYRLESGPDFTVTREGEHAFRVRGARIERAAKMTYWEYDEAVVRFQHILESLGIRQALADAGVQEGDTVRIGEYELEWAD